MRDQRRVEEIRDREQPGEPRRARQHEQHRENARRRERGDAEREPAEREPRPRVARQRERVAAERETEVDARRGRGMRRGTHGDRGRRGGL